MVSSTALLSSKGRITAQRGMSAVPFILMIGLFLLAAGTAYSFYTDRDEARLGQTKAEAARRTQTQLAISYKATNADVAGKVGFNSPVELDDPADVNQMASRVAELAAKYKAPDEATKLPRLDINDATTLEVLLVQLDAGMMTMVDKIKALESTVTAKDAEIATKEDAVKAVQAQLDARSTELQTSLKAVEHERDEAVSRADNETRTSRETINNVSETSEAARIVAIAERRKLTDQINIQVAAFDSLKTKEEVVHIRAKETDGKVVAAEVPSNLVVINRGRRDGLRLGTRFDVIRIIHMNVEMLVGVVEVRATTVDSADCSVVTVIDPLNPILPGDFVRNEIYDPLRTREFAFAGSVSNSRYSMEEIGKLVEEFGGRMVPKTAPTTDVIVLGAGYESDDNYKEGEKLHLEAIPEQELLRQLGR